MTKLRIQELGEKKWGENRVVVNWKRNQWVVAVNGFYPDEAQDHIFEVIETPKGIEFKET